MADLEDIVQHIRVDGVGEVGSTFVEMANDAESAFEKVAKAAESGSSGLALFGTGVVVIVVALTAAAVALAGLEGKTAKTVVKLSELGEAFGTTAAGMTALERAFQQVGVEPEKFEHAVSRMASSVANSMAQIHRQQRTADPQQESASEGMVAAALRVQDAQDKASQDSQEQSLKLRSDVLSVAESYHTLQFAAEDMASTTANN